MDQVTIFLASSSELKEDREDFRLFISEVNNEWYDEGIQFKPVFWEYFLDSFAEGGLQSSYNKAIAESDIFIMLFFTKVGKYTDEEFEIAFKQFENTKKPRLYVYFKDDFVRTGSIDDNIVSMLEFKKRLIKLKHYVAIYRSIDDLKWQFNQQLQMIYGNKFLDINSVTDQARIDTLAIERTCKLISPTTSEKDIPLLQLDQVIDKASEFSKNIVFQLGKVNRRSNRNNDRRLMARSIPIFQALINANKSRAPHFYFGQLAYALKDIDKSDWENAADNFNTAIDIRDHDEPEYFYEFNRAICHINICSGEHDKIIKDLSFSKQGIGKKFEDLLNERDNKILKDWLNKNKISPNEL